MYDFDIYSSYNKEIEDATIEYLHSKAYSALVQSNWKLAAENYNKIVQFDRLDDQLMLAYESLIRCLRWAGNLEASVKAGNEGVIKYPQNPVLQSQLGYSLCCTKNYKEGLYHLLLSLRIAPSPETNFLIGKFYIEVNRYHEAVNFLRRSVVSEPNNSEYNLYLGISLKKIGRFNEAESCILNSHNSSPQFDSAYQLSKIYLRRGQILKAIKYFSECYRSHR